MLSQIHFKCTLCWIYQLLFVNRPFKVAPPLLGSKRECSYGQEIESVSEMKRYFLIVSQRLHSKPQINTHLSATLREGATLPHFEWMQPKLSLACWSNIHRPAPLYTSIKPTENMERDGDSDVTWSLEFLTPYALLLAGGPHTHRPTHPAERHPKQSKGK